MKPWLRLTLITMTVGGGFTGFAVSLPLLIKALNQHPAYFVLTVGFLALYAFVTASGLIFAQNPRQTLPLFIAVALQIPWVSSPLMAYRFSAGFHVTIGLIQGRFNAGFRFGSDWQFSLLQMSPWGLGVNLFALAMLVLLAHAVQADNKRLHQTAAVPAVSDALENPAASAPAIPPSGGSG